MIFDESLEKLRLFIQNSSDVFAPVVVGAAPPGESIGIYYGAGSTPTEGLNRSKKYHLLLTVNSKSSDQPEAVFALGAVTKAFTQKGASYPAGDGWHVDSVKVNSPPQYVDVVAGAYIWAEIFDVILTGE